MADDAAASLTIGDLAERTGVSPATLRMWESRHNFPVPHRLESGHRRYTDRDVESVLAVVRAKEAGTRLEHAIAAISVDDEPEAPSIYAVLRKRHPGLEVHRLHKSTLIAMSWAIEDEFCSKADRPEVWGAFQRQKHYRSAQRRWDEIARFSASTTVFADFEESDAHGRPRRVALGADDPMRREWAVVCDADLPIVLTAWELPGQTEVPDLKRVFEAMWSIDGRAVRDASRVCASVAAGHGVGTGPDPAALAPFAEPESAAVTALFNRMVAYVDRLAG